MIDRPRTDHTRLARLAALSVTAGGMLWLGQAAFSAETVKTSNKSLAKGYNSNAPVNYAADRIELQDKANKVVLTGNVDVTQDTMRLRAARVTVNYTNNGSLKIQTMIATGGVFVTRGTDTAKGDVAVYDLVSRIITMSGHVTINRNGSTLNGGRAVMNLATGMSSIDAKPATAAPGPGTNGRVSGVFNVEKSK